MYRHSDATRKCLIRTHKALASRELDQIDWLRFSLAEHAQVPYNIYVHTYTRSNIRYYDSGLSAEKTQEATNSNDKQVSQLP